MIVKDVSISKSMTVNLGDYNSHRVEVGITASFDEGEDLAQGMEQLTTLVNQKLAMEVNQAKSLKKQTLMEGNHN